METIGQRLRRLRLDGHLSQRDLSAPGVSYAYISRIEADERRPSVKALRVLAEKLGVSVEYLETGEERTATDTLIERLARASDGPMTLTVWDEGGTVRVLVSVEYVQRHFVGSCLTEALRDAGYLLDELARIDEERTRLLAHEHDLLSRAPAA